MRCDPSLLSESTTKISSAQPIEERQRGRFFASFLIGTMTETGTRVELFSTVYYRSRFRDLCDTRRRTMFRRNRDVVSRGRVANLRITNPGTAFALLRREPSF